MSDVDNLVGMEEPLKREAWNWVLRMTSGHATRADMAALERWCAQSPLHARAFTRASGRWNAFGPAIESVLREEGGMPSSPVTRPARRLGRRAFLGGALAASAAGAAVMIARPPLDLWPSISEFAADYRTATGEQRHIMLAGSVSVEMNTRTSLNILSASHGDRIELITGEAAVTAGSQSIEVMAANGRALAQNAQFNIRYDGPTVCVTCLGGVVLVEQQGRSVSVQQKQQVSYTGHSLGQTMPIDPMTVTGWRKGDLFFQNEPLAQVIEEVNRYRSGKIILMNGELGQRRFTARFRLDRLDVVVTQLQATFGARVTSLPGGVVLVS
ncbi:MAG: DUF4880 domain-containing protein [Parvibaculaceae bacterium]|nr:DUF4880 domain-containing protein [Parvibaculaceae bacterium]